MIKKIFYFFFLTNLIFTSSHSKNDLYDKIDLFGEVLENVSKEYVDDVDEGEMMDLRLMEFSNLLILTLRI